MAISRAAALVIFLASMVVIPLTLLIWLLVEQDGSTLTWVLRASLGCSYMLFVFVTGYWGFVGYRLRYILSAAYLLALTCSVPGKFRLPFSEEGTIPSFFTHHPISILYLLLTAIIMYFTVRAVQAWSYHDHPIHLSFPFRNGNYYILEGGDSRKSRSVNYHFAGSSHQKSGVSNSMRYATDIVKLGSSESFAIGLLPVNVEGYHIFLEPLYSPCDGRVIEVVDSLDNEKPFSGHHPYNVGNRIIIHSVDANIVIGHIQKGSIKVHVGDLVKAGQEIARVGNSGLTEFPHLHIQAMQSTDGPLWNAQGIPILFDGKFLVKNTVFRR